MGQQREYQIETSMRMLSEFFFSSFFLILLEIGEDEVTSAACGHYFEVPFWPKHNEDRRTFYFRMQTYRYI
jgi:hypothetical protein